MSFAVKNTGSDSKRKCIGITGHLDFQTIPVLWRRIQPVVEKLHELHFDFSRVEGVSSSAALALLIEWIRYAEKTGKSLRFDALPAQLVSIGKAAGIGELLEKYCQP